MKIWQILILGVSESEIVRHITEFIKIPHEKIKEKYSQSKKDLVYPKKNVLKKNNIITGNNNMKKIKKEIKFWKLKVI